MTFMHPEVVEVRTPGASIDPYSLAEAVDWATWAAAPEACAVAPTGSAEPVEATRSPIDSDFDLLFDHEPSITVADRVVVRGFVCDVAGHPAQWRNPFSGWDAGWVVKAKIREG